MKGGGADVGLSQVKRDLFSFLILLVNFDAERHNFNQNALRCLVCYSQPGALQIEQSEESDQGKYECVATNNDGTRYSAPANLYVRGRKRVKSTGKTFLKHSNNLFFKIHKQSLKSAN